MAKTRQALERLGKWRVLLTGWQLGTRPKGDPECDAVRDHREVTLLLRVEATAITRVLLEKGIVTLEEFEKILAEEADYLSDAMERRFPGVQATSEGLTFDQRAQETMRDWKL